MNEDNKNNKKKSPAAFIISIVVFIAAVIAALLVLRFCTPYMPDLFDGIRNKGSKAQDSAVTEQTSVDTDTGVPEPELPENPIDFSEQMKVNDEIYAWIRIPNTNVDYPILQSREDDLYYLRRNLDKSYYIPGVLFTESVNKRDFSDPVTVIYGHNMSEDGSMFATLHYFEDEKFFKENEFFYVYTPSHILTYRVVSAYKYDNRHITNSFDFSDEKVREEYFDYVMNPVTIPMNVREGVTLSKDDKLLILSTCMASNTYRYLVNGVLVSDERTK